MTPGARVLLYVHGVIDDDPDRRWVAPLDAALRAGGGPGLEALGWELPAVRYLDLLEGEEPADADPPPETFRRGDEGDARRAYLLQTASLQRALGEGPHSRRPLWAPPAGASDWSVRHLDRPVFRWAREYTASPGKRAAILRRVLAAVPAEGDLVVIGHSLGSVVAADLIYHLPPDCRLRLLVTTGSPLTLDSLRRHLRRVERRFPFEAVGAWLNVAGAADPVTGGRGLVRFFPEVLDRVVDTGRDFKQAHDIVAYAREGTLAAAIRWVSGPRGAAETPLPEPRVPDEALLPLAVLQHALRLERALEPGTRRTRFATARRLRAELAAQQLGPALDAPAIVARFGADNTDALFGRLGPSEQVQLLLVARRWNPIEPWEIDLPAGTRRKALRALAEDLGASPAWAEVVWEAEDAARESQNARWGLGRAALVGAGVLAVVAAPALVFAAAPAGLAGGAAVAGGLAALGPGGMVGGLAVVGAVAGGGGAVAARGLSAGSAVAVEENVIAVQALALALRRLDLAPDDSAHWFTLVAMEHAVGDDLRRLRGVSDNDAAQLKELERKRKAIRRGLDWMAQRGLGPRPLEAADEDGAPSAGR